MTSEQLRALALTLAAETLLDPRTVVAHLEGRSVRASTRRAIEAAAARLGRPLPAAGGTAAAA